MEALLHKLPDVLEPGLKVVFCGTAAGDKSAKAGAYYAGPGNKFWQMLADTGMASDGGRPLKPGQFPTLPRYGIGLTDISKTYSGADSGLPDCAESTVDFRRRMELFSPAWIAFNGKKAASFFFGKQTSEIAFGPAEHIPGFPRIVILPSTSGAAQSSWDERYWIDFGKVFTAL